MVFQLDHNLWFPDPHLADDDGLVAVGGDLSVDRLILAYSYGFFPWFSFRCQKEPLWYCPQQRFVIFPGEIHVSHTMRQLLSIATRNIRKAVCLQRPVNGILPAGDERFCFTGRHLWFEDVVV